MNLGLRRQISETDPIEALDLNVRSYNALRRGSVYTVHDLLKMLASGNIFLISGIGEKSVTEIRVRLAEFEIEQNKENTIEATSGDALANISTRDILADVILSQASLIEKQLTAGLLHYDVKVSGKPLQYWLQMKESNPSIQLYQTYRGILGNSINICEEISLLFSNIPSQRVRILISRYGLTPKTLEAIGQELHLTRERIRQICVKMQRNIPPWFRTVGNTLRLQTALLIAKDMGNEITYENWRNTILLSGLVGQKLAADLAAIDPVHALIAIASASSESGNPPELLLPHNLAQAIQLASEGKSGLPARTVQLRTPPKELRRLIARHEHFSGALSAKWLSHETKIEISRIVEILQANGLLEINNSWFMKNATDASYEVRKNHVFHNSLRKMFLYCGPLKIDDVCSGLRSALSRAQFPTPPPDVMASILIKYGYKCEDDLFYWEGNTEVDLSESEAVILACIKENGRVVHHAELAEAFVNSTLSFPSLHAALNRSLLFVNIGKALYKLRGVMVRREEIERAEGAGERIPVNAEIAYTRRGEVEVTATLGILAVATGVIVSKQFPNLSGEWTCSVGEQEFGALIAVEAEFRRLGKVFKFLDCKTGDRVKFLFDTFTRRVSVTKVEA